MKIKENIPIFTQRTVPYIKITAYIAVLILCLALCSCRIHNSKDEDTEGVIVGKESQTAINLAIDSLDTLNPIFTKSKSVSDCMQLVFEPLFTFDEAFNPINVLAQSLMPSADFKSYTLKLYDNILWHDGTPLTANDVCHTINLIRFNDSRYTSMLKYITNVSVADNLTLTITLSRPVCNFSALLSFPIVKSNTSADYLSDYIPIGTGAFKYNSKAGSGKIRLSANENYSGEQPYISEIYLNVLKDANAVVNAFNASEIDAITSSLIDLRQNTPRGEIYTNDYTSNNLIFLGINCNSHIFSGANTRKALSYIIDKQNIVTNEIFSRAVVANLPLNPDAWYTPKTTSVSYDSDYIKEVLSLDGWVFGDDGYERTKTDGDEVKTEKLSANIIVNQDNEERYRIAVKIADFLNNAGIETTVTILDFEDYYERIRGENYTLFLGETELPKNMDLYSLLCTDDNYFAYYSQNMRNAVYKTGVAESVYDETTAFVEFTNVFNDEMPFIPLCFRKESVIYEKSMSGTSMPTVFTAYTTPEHWYISKMNKTASSDTSD